MSAGPLASVRVVAVEQAVAAPACTRHLGELGADVVKIEHPSGGDFARAYDTNAKGHSTHFVWLNGGKRSVALDLKDPAGWQAFVDLASVADVLVTNLSPSASLRIVDDPSILLANPRLVRCVISGYGLDGPFRDRKAFDLLVQGEAGVTLSAGTTDQPAKPGVSLADLSAGLYALAGILAALIGRRETGVGDRVEVSLFDSVVEWMEPLLLAYMCAGTVPPPAGTRHATICPYGPFQAADGSMLNLAVENEAQRRSLTRDMLEDSELASDPCFYGNEARVARRDEVERRLGERVATMSPEPLSDRLDAAGVPWGRLNDVAAVAEHPQLARRDRWEIAQPPDGGAVPVVASPIGFSAGSGRGRDRIVPALGEHTDEVLQELGYGPERRAALYAAGAAAVNTA